MKQHITIEQLETLSPQAKQRLEDWFDNQYDRDDDLVRVYIPEEKDGPYHNGGTFAGHWDEEFDFDYPEPYTGKLKNHRGTILPLLDIGQMVAILALSAHFTVTITPSEDACDVLWEAVKRFLEGENSEH